MGTWSGLTPEQKAAIWVGQTPEAIAHFIARRDLVPAKPIIKDMAIGGPHA